MKAGSLHHDTVGLASTLRFCCDGCDHRTELLPRKRKVDPYKLAVFDSHKHRSFSKVKRIVDYEVNVRTVLASQSAGMGQSEMSRVAALLCLTSQRALFGNVWSNLEERVAIQEKILCKVVVDQNLEMC